MTASAPPHLAPLLPGAVLMATARVEAAARESRWPLHVVASQTAAASIVVEPPEGLRQSARRWVDEMGVPLVAEATAIALIAELDAPLESGWCECTQPRLPPRRVFTWEDHEWGSCGWPTTVCGEREHRLSRCRGCRRALRHQLCELEPGGTGYSRDDARGWWVHEVCGWPTSKYLAGAAQGADPALDGTPTPLWRVFRGRSERDAKLMPFPNEQLRRLDAQMNGKVYFD